MNGRRSAGTVRFSETDASGWIHFTNPLIWVENAEHELYRRAGVPVRAFPRRAVQASYERPLTAGEPYVVDLGVSRLGASSITYEWRVLGRDEVCISGSHTVVHVDATGRPTELPDGLRDVLARHTTEPTEGAST